MTKINNPRTFDIAELANKEGAKDVMPFVEDTNSKMENILRTLLNGISFADNVSAVERLLELKDSEPTVVGVARPVSYLGPCRSMSRDFPLSAPVHMYYDDQNQLTVVAKFSPVPTVAIKVKVVLLFE